MQGMRETVVEFVMCVDFEVWGVERARVIGIAFLATAFMGFGKHNNYCRRFRLVPDHAPDVGKAIDLGSLRSNEFDLLL